MPTFFNQLVRTDLESLGWSRNLWCNTASTLDIAVAVAVAEWQIEPDG